MARKKPTNINDPENGISQDLHVSESADSLGIKTPPIDTDLKAKESKKKHVVKQDAVAEVITGQGGSAGSDVSGGVMAMKSGDYSGNEGTITGGLSQTPIVEAPSRGRTRFEKKRDVITKQINSITSEQILLGFDEPKALAQNPEAVQGYNGTRRNDVAKVQKIKGGSPASPHFVRSLDNIKRDHLYFAHGQVVKQKNVDYKDNPNTTWNLNDSGVWVEDDIDSSDLKQRGTFVPRSLKYSINSDGVITSMVFTSDDITPIEDSADIVNASAPHAKTFVNQVELYRREMDAVAGDESKENWSPLPRAVNSPSRSLGYMYDLEQDTGNVMLMALRYAQKSLAYQLNVAAKDGTDRTRPIIEAIEGLNVHANDSSVFADRPTSDVFNSSAYQNGLASFLIGLFDSTGKFTTKADFLSLPRSFRMHLQTGSNYVSNFRCNQDFLNVLKNIDVMSTLDKEYDPLSPVFINENNLITSPYDWNEQFGFSDVNSDGSPSFSDGQVVRIGYSEQRQRYITTLHHPLLKGLYDFLSKHADKIYSMGTGSGTRSFSVPIVYSSTKIALWPLLLMAAASDIENARLASMRELLDYERRNGEYPFKDLVQIKSVDPHVSVNYRCESIDQPIQIARMSKAAALPWRLPELYWNFDEQTRSATQDWRFCLLPWYFTESQFTVHSNKTATFYGDRNAMSWPVSRNGIRFGPLDAIYDYEEREARLCLDRQVRPLRTSFTSGDFGMYKYDQSSDGIPFIAYRVGGSDANSYTVKDYLAIPRELGLYMVLPYGYASPMAGSEVSDRVTLSITDPFQPDTSYSARVYHSKYSFPAPSSTSILDPTSINIDRDMNYVQEWHEHKAVGYPGAKSNVHSGFTLSISELFSPEASGELTPVDGLSLFNPFTDGYVKPDGSQDPLIMDELRLVTVHKAYWTRLQLLPMAISPWDAVSRIRSMGEDGSKFDLFDFLYFFGLAGFMASDYEEDMYNRMNKQLNEGYQFTRDLFIDDSLINSD